MLVGVSRHGAPARALVVMNMNEGHLVFDVVDGAREQEKSHLVDARHRLKLRGAQPRAIGEKLPAFHVRL